MTQELDLGDDDGPLTLSDDVVQWTYTKCPKGGRDVELALKSSSTAIAELTQRHQNDTVGDIIIETPRYDDVLEQALVTNVFHPPSTRKMPVVEFQLKVHSPTRVPNSQS